MVKAILGLDEVPRRTTPPTRSRSRSATRSRRRCSGRSPRDRPAARPAVAGRAGQALIVDVNGVGYLVARDAVGARLGGDEITVEMYTVVREDALQLYGFATADERELFELLLGVNGVGPKVALAIVSGSHAGRAAPRDRARGHGALPGDPRHRPEDGRARRARAEGEAGLADATRGARRGGELTARDALVELGWALIDAERALADVDPSCRSRSRCGRRCGAAA